MTRAIWGDEGTDANDALLKANGITQFFISGKDAKYANLAHLNALKARGFAPGIYLCSQGDGWIAASSTPPEMWATWAYHMIQKQIAPGTSGSFPKVHLNCETHDPAWLLAMLKQWRAHSPKRETALVIEGMQGGWYRQIAAAVASLRITVYAEAFHGAMIRSESEAVLRDLLEAGVPLDRAGVCLDASQLGDWWQGVGFTQGRLA